MENSSSNNHSDFVATPEVWGLTMALLLANLAVLAYLTAALVRFGQRTGKLRPPYNRTVTRLLLLGLCCPLVAVFNSLCTVANLLVVRYFLTPGDDRLCDVGNKVINTGLSMPFVSAYGFLWYRQHIFYGSPALRQLFSPAVSAVSYASLPCFLLSMAAMNGAYNAGARYEMAAGGCQLSAPTAFHRYFVMLVFLVILVSFSVITALFLYPLYNRRAYAGADSGAVVQRAIRKSVLSLLVLAVSSVALLAVTSSVIPASVPRYVVNTAFVLTSTSYVAAVIFSYDGSYGILTSGFRRSSAVPCGDGGGGENA